MSCLKGSIISMSISACLLRSVSLWVVMGSEKGDFPAKSRSQIVLCKHLFNRTRLYLSYIHEGDPVEILPDGLKIVMNDGEEMEIHPGDAIVIPPGHDALVVGDEPCVLIDWQGYTDYAKR